jgi:uncharacterized protein YmfQ (DUF2313 family)
MGLKIAAPETYQASIRRLFPQGDYWDKQFSGTQSDCNAFVQAKTASVLYIRGRMSNLLDEGFIPTATETIEEWEKTLTGGITVNLTIEQRRQRLLASRCVCLTRSVIKNIAEIYGITVSTIELPYKPAFFGFSRFGVDRLASPASFSVVFIRCSAISDESAQIDFETQLRKIALANYIIYIFYGGADNARLIS